MFIKSKYIFLEDRILENAALEIKDGKIKAIHEKANNISSCIDYGNAIIAPGFVDSHIHGYAGFDVMDKSEEALDNISQEILKTGVTSFLATTLTDTVENLNETVKLVGDYKNKSKGAKIQGIFLEGPFFSLDYKGAQDSSCFLDPNIDILKKWQELSGGLIKKIALAPELKNSLDFIKEAKKMGIYTAIGHSNSKYEEAKSAIEAGASIFVHGYNAMSPLHHREAGLVGAMLTFDNSYAEIICDGQHVSPVAIDVLFRCKNKKNIALITDCMMAGGMKDGHYKLGNFDVNVENGSARLKNGKLAGSTLKLIDAVKNIIAWGLASPFEAIQMASLIPAKSVGIDNLCGKIDLARDADLVILDNNNYDIKAVYLNGEIVK